MKAKRLILITCLLLALLGGLLRWQYARRLQYGPELRYGRFTRTQILDRTLPLCSLLWPQQENYRFSADTARSFEGPSSLSGNPQTLPCVWNITCEDTDGNYLGTFSWNADTGELLQLGLAYRPHEPVSIYKEAELLRLSQQWLRDLGFVQKEERWKLREIETKEHSVMFHWISSYRRVDMLFEKDSRLLLLVNANRIKYEQPY